MTNFEKAYGELLGMEGSYSNDSSDKGGETFCGISRKNHPSWGGWSRIDAKKVNGVLSGSAIKTLTSDQSLMSLVQSFYKTEFWDKFDCDSWPYSLSLELFEEAVNLGVGRTSRHLQQLLNAMNYRNGRIGGFGSDLTVDGIFGRASMARLKDVVDAGYGKAVQYGMNGLQCQYYIQRAIEVPSQKEFLKGWLNMRTSAIWKE